MGQVEETPECSWIPSFLSLSIPNISSFGAFFYASAPVLPLTLDVYGNFLPNFSFLYLAPCTATKKPLCSYKLEHATCLLKTQE